MIFLKAFAVVMFASASLLATSVGSAAICTPGTLASYLLLPSQGCSIAGSEVKVMDFVFQVLTPPALPATAADIQVNPVTLPGSRYGLLFSSLKFNVSGTDAATYEIRYVFDPADIRSMEDVMTSNSPVPPGTATITTEGCKGAAFVGMNCPGTPTVPIVVFDNGNTSGLTGSAPVFPPESILGVRHVIDLQPNGMSSQFDSLQNVVVIPEPSSWLLVFAGSVFLGLRARRQRRIALESAQVL